MKKKLLAMLLGMAMAVTLITGCGNQNEETPVSQEEPVAAAEEEPEAEAAEGTAAEESEGGKVIGFCPPTMNNPFFYYIEQNVREAVEAKGDTLITMDPQLDSQKQIEQVEDLLLQDIDALLLCPFDSTAIKPALVAADEAGVPVIVFDTKVVDDEYAATTVASDNINAGRVVGEDLAGKLEKGSKIAVIYSPAGETDRYRLQGFEEGIEGMDYEIVAKLGGKGDTGVSMPLAEDILQANADLGAFFCCNDQAAIGAVQAIESAGKTGEVLVYGVDGSPEGKAAIAEGTMTGTGAQSPANIGLKAVDAAYSILAGETVEKDTVVETFLINADNVNEYGTDGWQ